MPRYAQQLRIPAAHATTADFEGIAADLARDAQLLGRDADEAAPDVAGGEGTEEMVDVLDTSAKTKVRHHTLHDGNEYEFEPKRWKRMPLHLVRHLIGGPPGGSGFLIRTLTGLVLRSQPMSYMPDEVLHLRTDQVIADLHELSAEALSVRCNKHVDGNIYTKLYPRVQMIGFLIEKANALAEAHVVARRRKARQDNQRMPPEIHESMAAPPMPAGA